MFFFFVTKINTTNKPSVLTSLTTLSKYLLQDNPRKKGQEWGFIAYFFHWYMRQSLVWKMATKSSSKTVRLRRTISMNKVEDIYKEEFKDRKNQPDKPWVEFNFCLSLNQISCKYPQKTPVCTVTMTLLLDHLSDPTWLFIKIEQIVCDWRMICGVVVGAHGPYCLVVTRMWRVQHL